MEDNEYADYDEYIKFNNGTSPYISDNNINKMQRMIKADIDSKIKNEITKVTTLSSISANTNYTVSSYTVGNNSLSIFYEGCKLIKDENYIEVGTEGEESTTIQFKDWDVPVGSKIEFVYK